MLWILIRRQTDNSIAPGAAIGTRGSLEIAR